MEQKLKELVGMSRYYGSNPEYIIAGGGNSSFKNDRYLWVKSSGVSMESIDEEGFVCLDRELMKVISEKSYSEDAVHREQEVKADMNNAITGDKSRRPSVEASLHNLFQWDFVMHTHPSLVNGLLCAFDSEKVIKELFGDTAVYIPYSDPGYILFKKVEETLKRWSSEKGQVPHIIFLENHGVFVGAETVEEIRVIYQKIMQLLQSGMTIKIPRKEENENKTTLIPDEIYKAYPEGKTVIKADNGFLARIFSENRMAFAPVSRPFTPDNIVYCKSSYLFVEDLRKVKDEVNRFRIRHSYLPRIICVQSRGVFAIEEDEKSAATVQAIFGDMMKVSYLSRNFGGPRSMTDTQIEFIDNWEVENYRRRVAKN